MGAAVISFGPADLQTNTGETLEDTGRVLSSYIDALVLRTNGPISEMRSLALGLPAVINAMSNCEHPTQALADYCCIQERFGKLEGLSLAYFGTGNNTAVGLALLCSSMPSLRAEFFIPKAFSFSEQTMQVLTKRAKRSGASFIVSHSIPPEPAKVDVVYTSRWRTMGIAPTDPDWAVTLNPYRVDRDLYERFARSGHTILMHDLPAVRGEEITDEMLHHDDSIVWRQAHHKLSAAKGSLLYSLGY